MSPIPVFDEVAFIANASDRPIGETVGCLSAKDLEEIRSLVSNPPLVVQRTLEVACLILNAGRSPGRRLGAPEWTSVQRTLSDADFPSRVLEYDVEQLRAAPGLCTFIANDYFKPNNAQQRSTSGPYSQNCSGLSWYPSRPSSQSRVSSPAGVKRRGPHRIQEPLTFTRVHRASHAASSLFRWCADVVDAAAAISEPPMIPVAEFQVELTSQLAQPLPPEPRGIFYEEVTSARATRAKVKTCQDRVGSLTLSRSDRYFECFVAFVDGDCSPGPQQVAQLRLVATAMKKRPSLALHVQDVRAASTETVDPGCNSDGEQRLYSAKLFFAAEAIPFECMPAEESDPQESSEGVLCTLRMDADEELLDFFAHGPGSEGKANPTCPNGHALRRCMAHGHQACGACTEIVSATSCFYGCACYSVCSPCFAKLSAGGRTDVRDIARWLSQHFRMR